MNVPPSAADVLSLRLAALMAIDKIKATIADVARVCADNEAASRSLELAMTHLTAAEQAIRQGHAPK